MKLPHFAPAARINLIGLIVAGAVLVATVGCSRSGIDIFDTDPNVDSGLDTRLDALFDATVQNSCGDGVVASGEECDDGNNNGGDGCDEICRRERMSDDLCRNDRDSEIVESGVASDAAVYCFEPCYDGDVRFRTDCMTDCMIQDAGLSDSCASCYTLAYDCILVQCLGACDGSNPPDCDACQTEWCPERFYECAGVSFL